MEYLREKLKEDLGITDDQYNELVRQARAESTVKNDIDNMGNMSALQVQLLNDIGMQMSAIMFKIMQLEVRK